MENDGRLRRDPGGVGWLLGRLLTLEVFGSQEYVDQAIAKDLQR